MKANIYNPDFPASLHYREGEAYFIVPLFVEMTPKEYQQAVENSTHGLLTVSISGEDLEANKKEREKIRYA